MSGTPKRSFFSNAASRGCLWLRGKRIQTLTNQNRRLIKNEEEYIKRQRELKAKLDASELLSDERSKRASKLERKIKRLENAALSALALSNNNAKAMAGLKDTRREQKNQIDELTADIQRFKEQSNNLRLTLVERSTYIAEVEETIQRRDTEIALLRMEVETLTLWREKINQQFRTEADIEAAKSHVLQGRNVDQTLENLTRGDHQKNNR
jgi:chromosome segregation ATPase